VKAAQLIEPGRVECVEVPTPEDCADGEVILRTVEATICGSDLHNIFAGTSLEDYPSRPGYPGHESVGEVVLSRVPGVQPGDLILAVPDLSCSAAFAEYQVVPAHFLVPLPPRPHAGNLVLAQQLGTVVYAMKRFWPAGRPGLVPGTAVVLGSGTAGVFFIRLLKAAGFGQILASDVIAGRLDRARATGATKTALVPEENPIDLALAMTDGEGADLVIEAAGEDSTRADALEAVRISGRVGYFGTPSSLEPVLFPINTYFRRKPTLETAHSAQHEDDLASFRGAAGMIASGELDVSGVLTNTFGIDSIAEALQLAFHPSQESLKVSIAFG
jgi:L-iditol 2-dehydrogenase